MAVIEIKGKTQDVPRLVVDQGVKEEMSFISKTDMA